VSDGRRWPQHRTQCHQQRRIADKTRAPFDPNERFAKNVVLGGDLKTTDKRLSAATAEPTAYWTESF
jgi:hypothetical protein